jgi:hypothetical protein
LIFGVVGAAEPEVVREQAAWRSLRRCSVGAVDHCNL